MQLTMQEVDKELWGVCLCLIGSHVPNTCISGIEDVWK